MIKRTVLVLLIIATLVLSSCVDSKVGTYTAYSVAMDTQAAITVYGNNKASAEECARLFEQLDKLLSVTAENSSVAKLNKRGYVEASDELSYIISQANRIKEETNGAFNVCVYPLVKLWGFTTGEHRVPTDDEIKAAALKVASSSVWVENGNAVLSEGALVDFGAIAKGYASEKMAHILKENGVGAAVISLGGNIRTVGKKPDGTDWRIGINSPNGNGIIGTLSLGEAAVVTSGSYLRCFEENGTLYHHIIDPQSGYPAANGLVSVTVVADDATLADGLSTAFFVMGMDKAVNCAQKLGVEAVFVTETTITVTQGLKKSFTPDKSIEGVYKTIYLD